MIIFLLPHYQNCIGGYNLPQGRNHDFWCNDSVCPLQFKELWISREGILLGSCDWRRGWAPKKERNRYRNFRKIYKCRHKRHSRLNEWDCVLIYKGGINPAGIYLFILKVKGTHTWWRKWFSLIQRRYSYNVVACCDVSSIFTPSIVLKNVISELRAKVQKEKPSKNIAAH